MQATELIHELHPLLLRRRGERFIDDQAAPALCARWMGGRSGRELYDLLRECLIVVQGLASLNRADKAVEDMHRLFIEPIGDAMLGHARSTIAAERHRKNCPSTNQPMGAAFKTQGGGVGLRKT